jgi:hypothetical protein
LCSQPDKLGRFRLLGKCELAEPLGYAVGRLFPNHVAFKGYEYSDDNFRMGNLIAAKDPQLKKRLS